MGKKILLADDSITIQKVIELTFSDEDFEVVTVGNGRLAIERVQDVRPDVVLCDIIMPEKDGYEVCEFIKKHPALSHVPVLLLTGAFEPFDQERAVRVGSDGFLAKPFEPQTLIAKVKELLNQAAARTGAARPAAPAPAPVAVAPAPAPVPPTIVPAPAAPRPPAYVPAPPPAYAPPAYAAPAPAPAPAPPPAFAPPPPAPVWNPAPAPSAPAWNPPAPPAPEPAAPEVSFISDEPFLDAPLEEEPAFETSGGMPLEAAPSPALDEDLYAPDNSVPMQELMEVEPEEAAALQPPPPEPASLPPQAAPTWAESTMEVSYEERAQAGIAAQAEAGNAAFEEVFDAEPRSAPAAIPDVFSRFAGEMDAPPPTTTPVPPTSFDSAYEPAPAFEPMPPMAEEPEPPAPVYAPPPAPPEPPPVAAASFASRPPAYPAPAPPPAPAPEPPPRLAEPPVSEPMFEPEGEVLSDSFAEVAPAVVPPAPAPSPSIAADIAVPADMVSQIAQRVLAQISDKVVREVAWEVIPDLAEALIKKEIERLKAELQKV